MSTLGERIRYARTQKDISQGKLAELVGTKSLQVISNWERDLNKPDAESIVRLCEVLDVSASYLLDYYGKTSFETTIEEENLIRKYRSLDAPGRDAVDYILSHETDRAKQIDTLREPLAQYGQKVLKVPYGGMNAAAGNFIDWVDAITDTIECEENASSRRADFAVGVSGDSMEPTYSDRDIVLVKRNTQIAVGKIGVFYLEAENELYIKELGNGELISHNPNYPPIRSTNGFSCIGEVLGKAVLV